MIVYCLLIPGAIAQTDAIPPLEAYARGSIYLFSEGYVRAIFYL